MAKSKLPRLILLTDTRQASPEQIEHRFGLFCRAAAPRQIALELRDRELPTGERLVLGRRLRRLAADTDQLFAVNDRLDLAVLLEAEILHLGEGSVSTTDARKVVGSGVLVIRAVHSSEQIAEVDADGVILAPIMAPRKGRPALGTLGLIRARERLTQARSFLWLYALGGITAGNIGQCRQAGADGVAVIGAGLNVHDPSALLQELGILRRVG